MGLLFEEGGEGNMEGGGRQAALCISDLPGISTIEN